MNDPNAPAVQRTVTARIEDLMEVAALLGKTALVAGEKAQSQEDLAMKLSLGRTLGLPDAVAVSGIMVVNGNPSVWGKAKLGIAQRSGKFDFDAFSVSVERKTVAAPDPKRPGEIMEVPDLVATVTVGRVGGGKVTVEYGWADACRAGLNGKATYSKFPKDMLLAKAMSRALDLLFSDVLLGVGTTEDAIDVDFSVDPEPSGPLALPKARKATPEPAPPVIEAAPVVVETDGLTEPQTAAQERFAAVYPDLPADTLRRFIVDSTRDGEISFHAVESAIMAHTKGTN